MSTTIGFGCKTEHSGDVVEATKRTAYNAGYGVEFSWDAVEVDVRHGIQAVARQLAWNVVAVLRVPSDQPANMAFGIDEELQRFEFEGKRPQFFDFLQSLSAALTGTSEHYVLFFAAEWEAQERARYFEGRTEDVIQLLSQPGHWPERLYNSTTGSLEDSDEVPLMAKVRLRE